MEIEELSKVEIDESGKMFLVLTSGGKPSYQHIYREAAEVHWDDARKAFKAPAPRKWTHVDWYQHIIKVAASIGIKLVLTGSTVWVNVPTETKTRICSL